MLWEEVLLEKGQNAEFSSKPQPSKYNLNDTFFRKAFMKKPEVSEATAQFNKARTLKREMESKKHLKK